MLTKANYKSLMEKSVFFKQVFYGSVHPSVIVKPGNLRIIDANDACTGLIGFSHSEMTKKYLYDIHPVKLQAKLKKQYENFIEKDLFTFDLPVICKNKEKIYSSMNFKKFTFKSLDVFIVVIFDLTERIELEKSIKEENHQLLDKTKELLQINRNLILSYESLKKKFKDFRTIQKQELHNERKSVILEISDIIKEKINLPLGKVLDDIEKIKQGGKDFSKETSKRLKMMEEVIENMLITMSRISEERDIQKMRYVDLENID